MSPEALQGWDVQEQMREPLGDHCLWELLLDAATHFSPLPQVFSNPGPFMSDVCEPLRAQILLKQIFM